MLIFLLRCIILRNESASNGMGFKQLHEFIINTEFMQYKFHQTIKKDTKVVDIIYFSKQLFVCFDVSVL